MTKQDNCEDAVLRLILQNRTNGIFGDNPLARSGTGADSTNLYLNLHTNGLAETASNLNETAPAASLVGYPAYTNVIIPRSATNWSNLSAGLFASGPTSAFTFTAVNDSQNAVVTHWSLSSANGNLLYTGPLSDSDPQPFTSEDGNVTNSLTAVAHGFASNEAIILIALPNVTFPTGVSSNTLVYVTLSNGGESALPAGGDFLRVKSGPGALAPLNIGSGAGLIAGMNQQTLANNNTPRFVTNALRITED